MKGKADLTGELQIYLNTEKLANATGIGYLYPHVNPIGLGGLNGGCRVHDGQINSNAFFNGDLMDFAIYNIAISESNINHLTRYMSCKYLSVYCASCSPTIAPSKHPTLNPLTFSPTITRSPTSATPSAHPVSFHPLTLQPLTSQPLTSQPLTSQPLTSQPLTSQPLTSQPGTISPVSLEPSISPSNHPATLQPVSGFMQEESLTCPEHVSCEFKSNSNPDFTNTYFPSSCLPTSGLSTSGLATSGLATSDFATSGLATSGLATSGLATSGLATSGLATSSHARPLPYHGVPYNQPDYLPSGIRFTLFA
ncbi:hypothetical protein AAMO2058_001571600 [Amorphochlora amoebiformis]